MQASIAKLDQRHASIVAISVDDPQESRLLRASLELTFPLLADEGGAVASQYGVLMEREELAIPSVFVIGKDGAIAWRHVGETVPDRPTPDAVAAAIDAMPRRARGG